MSEQKIIQHNDILVNLKALNKTTETNMRLIPRTKAEAIIETEDQQFISKKLKDSIYNKQDNLGYTPLNKSGDKMTGPLYLLSNFTEDNQAVSKAYVDNKIRNLINSSPEALDTLYELAAAINNDPNFAVTVTTLLSKKLNSDEVSNIKTPNKILRLDADAELNTNIKGNAQTAFRLKQGFYLKLKNRYFNDPSIYIDGSKNVDLTINTPLATASSDGLMAAEDYVKLYALSDNIKKAIGIRSIAIELGDFVNNTSTGDYVCTKNLDFNASNFKLGVIQVYKSDNGSYSEIITDIKVSNFKVTITSLSPFTGKLVYNLEDI